MPQRTETQKWEASILRMSEDHFFDIIHAYFGEIETPFNKHKLLEKLSSFLLNESVREKIISTLSYEDLKLLSCINYLKNPTVRMLFFVFDVYASEIRAKLVNLEERLLIYRETDDNNYNKVRYSINPLLLDVLLSSLGNSLFLLYEKLEKEVNIEPLLTPVFFSSIYSYIYSNADVYKKDGHCKKKVYDNLSNIFPMLKGKEEVIDVIFRSFINLKLIKKVENEIIIIEEHWQRFASLSHIEKLIYLCVSRVFSVDYEDCSINPQAVFSDLLTLLKKGAWYNEEDIYRVLFLIYLKHSTNLQSISFDNYVFFRTFKWSVDYEDEKAEALSIAEAFGLIIRKNNLLCFNEYFRNIEEDEKPLLISSTYEVTISQLASLNNLIPILPGVKIIKSQTFATFEFNRQTCENLFQKEMDSKRIIESLQSVSKHPLPQNVGASIDQWYNSYKSISLYSGIVLCVDEKRKKFFMKGSPLSSLVKKEITDGVYLLNSFNIKEINKQLKKSGLDFIIFNYKDCDVNLGLSYSKLDKKIDTTATKEKKELLNRIKKCEAERLLEEEKLIEKLGNKKLDENLKEILIGRIKRRVVLTEKQLDPLTIHKTQREIKAFDFLGKLKFLEEAKNQKYLLEITTSNKNIITGYVEDLLKNINNNVVIEINDDSSRYSNTKYIDVSQILKIKVVVQSIFS